MDAFIDRIISQLKPQYGNNYNKLCIIFPTRRACLIFRNKLAESYDTPIWAPGILSIGDFVGRYSNIKVVDEIPLLITLFDVYKKHWTDQDFGKYYSWGKMLLNDFDELDKQLHNPKNIFKNINELRKLEAAFLPEVDSLTWIKDFISSIDEHKLSRLQKEFSDNWNRLESIYFDYNELLDAKNIAYEGKAYKQLISQLTENNHMTDYDHFVFAGFYGFSKAEEKVIKLLSSKNKVSLFWDADSWYIDYKKHEAGYYFRKSELTNSGFDWVDQNFLNSNKKIELISVPLAAGQAKYAGDLLNTLFKSGNLDINTTAVILPDEDMLFPVLHSLPPEINPVNVTMGYPLKNGYFSNLFDVLFDLQRNVTINKNKEVSFFRIHIERVLNHPLVANLLTKKPSKNTTSHYRIIKNSDIKEQYNFDASDTFFTTINSSVKLFEYINAVLKLISKSLAEKDGEITKYENIIINYLESEISLLSDQLIDHISEIAIETCWEMIRETVNNMKIPFSGEPVKGLQVMGFLETRALDFETVIILNVNEGILPTEAQAHSFIPYSLRKAFGLSTMDDREASYSYHFYRLFHKAKNIYLVYNSEVGKTGAGEPSRYLLQIEYELKKFMGDRLTIIHKTINTPIKPIVIPPIIIQKSEDIISKLSKYQSDYIEDDKKKFSASALSTYINCSLQFYFKYIARIKENESEGKYMDAAELGNILHTVMDSLYHNVNDKNITETTIKNLASISDDLVEKSINEIYKVPYSQLNGNDIITTEVIKELVKRVLQADLKTVPFKIVSLEEEYETTIETNKNNYRLFGKFDRVDEANNNTRIIDYKTGNIELKYKVIDELFKLPKKKTLFQLYLYSLIYANNYPDKNFDAGFYSARSLSGGVIFPSVKIDLNELQQFREHLAGLINEIINPNIPFVQTDDVERCEYCPYKEICNR